jgi:hypothetical protein
MIADALWEELFKILFASSALNTLHIYYLIFILANRNI